MLVYPVLLTQAGKPLPCPLHRVKVVADIAEYLAEVRIEQQYLYAGKSDTEIVYTFPLPHKAVVTAFSARVGETEIKGEVQERQQARRAYEDAMREGDTPFLMESHRQNVFQVSLGRIRPQEKVSVSLSYIEVPPETDGEVRFLLPTVVAPRYVPGKERGEKQGPGVAHPTDRVPDADFVTPPVGEADYTLDFTAHVSLAGGIASITSPSHRIAVNMQANRARVTLATESELLNRDFILVCKPRQEAESVAVVGEPPYGDYAHVRLAHLFKGAGVAEGFETQEHSPREYIFLLDISGSMDGNKLTQAKKALRICLRNLELGDCFNIVAFESRFMLYSPHAVEYTQQQLENADLWLGKLRSNGGTEIYEPLAHVLKSTPPCEGLERVVLLFTDGQVSNEAEVIEMVRSHRHGVSLFTFGIDTAVNTAFIDGVAEAGHGLPEYIYPGERIEEKVIRQFARLAEPYLAKVALESVSGKALATAPTLPARLYGGDAYTFVGHSPGLHSEPHLILRGWCINKPYSIAVPLHPGANGRLLALRWAQERIRTILQLIEQSSESKAAALEKEAVDLSLQHGILSSFTAFLAIHRRADKATGEVTTTVAPVALPEAWSVVFESMSAPGRSYSRARRQQDSTDSSSRALFAPSHYSFVDPSRALSFMSLRSDAEQTVTPQDDPVKTIIYQVTAQQNADGSYGRGAEQMLQTARFVIGLLHAEVDWTPYRNQLKKAGLFLLDKARGNSLSLLAINLLVRSKVIHQKSEVQMIAQFIDELPADQSVLVKAADDSAIEIILAMHRIHVSASQLLQGMRG